LAPSGIVATPLPDKLKAPQPLNRLTRLLTHPANWCGLALASAVLVLQGLGWLGAWGVGLAAVAYAAGFAVAGLWLGWPKLSAPDWEGLEFSDEGDARQAMTSALTGVRGLVQYNPDNRLPASLQTQVLGLCSALEGLLNQWERSKGALSLQESFHARHIAISYLPDALKTYLSIPPQFAGSRVLQNGKTAQDTFRETLTDLGKKVSQLADDLASQDAHAFLSHSQFLHDKFGAAGVLPAPVTTGRGPPTSP
jgi:hypothetical protein